MAEKYVEQEWHDLNKAFPVSAARQIHQEKGITLAQQTGEEAAANSVPLTSVGVTVPSTEHALKIKGTPVAGQVLTATSSTTAAFEAPVGGLTRAEAEAIASVIPGEVVTGSRALMLTDVGKILICTSSAGETKIEVPKNATVALAIGTVVEIYRKGSSPVEITWAAGVTVQTPASYEVRKQYSTVGLRKEAAEEWVLSGDLK